MIRHCTRCQEDTWIELFRMLSSGWRSSMCRDCERAYDRQRDRQRRGYPELELVSLDEIRNTFVEDAHATETSRLADISEYGQAVARHIAQPLNDGTPISEIARRYGKSENWVLASLQSLRRELRKQTPSRPPQ